MNRKVCLMFNIQAPISVQEGLGNLHIWPQIRKEIPGLGILVIFSFVGYLAANTVRGPVVLSPRFTAGT
jgi:hypothetical protein